MAVSVPRTRLDVPEERWALYGARLAAFAGYAAAVSVGALLLGPVLRADDGAATATLNLPEPRIVEARSGDSLAGLAASEGVSIARLLALNPELQPLGVDAGVPVRVR
jgi:LysM repeat protein